MLILSDQSIKQKIKRLSYEILENNISEKQIILAGINNNGYRCAKLIFDFLKTITEKDIILANIKLNPAKPTESPITIDLPNGSLKNKTIIIIDDVANTGRTIFYAFKIFMDLIPKKIEVAALVDRKHKMFPIKVDYVGLSLATTIKEHIKADLINPDNISVSLV
jgi:pyrimidine operon attenuation protein / uracil phosphoribosyltransferase